jgi:inosose dehydratase
MQTMKSRREFIVTAGAAAIGSALPLDLMAHALAPPMYPDMDLSYFDTPITPAPGLIRTGYSAITWNRNDLQAIKDIAAVGYDGIQLRSNILPEYGEKPKALRDLLAEHHLTFVAFSSGSVKIDPALEQQTIAEHASQEKFVHDAGGMYLQVSDERPKGRDAAADDYTRMGRLLTEIGKRSADLGVTLGYHNHARALGERPEEIDQVLGAADPRYVKLELDTAYYQMAGGDNAAVIRKYRDRVLFLHVKDFESPVPDAPPDRNYRFLELGRGKVDFKAIFAALADVKFRGWAIVELDSPTKDHLPKESAEISRKYLEDLGVMTRRANAATAGEK